MVRYRFRGCPAGNLNVEYGKGSPGSSRKRQLGESLPGCLPALARADAQAAHPVVEGPELDPQRLRRVLEAPPAVGEELEEVLPLEEGEELPNRPAAQERRREDPSRL